MTTRRLCLDSKHELLVVKTWTSCNCQKNNDSITCKESTHIYPWSGCIAYDPTMKKLSFDDIEWKNVNLITVYDRIITIDSSGKLSCIVPTCISIKYNDDIQMQHISKSNIELCVSMDSLIYAGLGNAYGFVHASELTCKYCSFKTAFYYANPDIQIKNASGNIMNDNECKCLLQFILIWYLYGFPIYGWGTNEQGLYNLGEIKYVVTFHSNNVDMNYVRNLCDIIGLKYFLSVKSSCTMNVYCDKIYSFLNVIRTINDPMYQRKILPSFLWKISPKQMMDMLDLPNTFCDWNIIQSQLLQTKSVDSIRELNVIIKKYDEQLISSLQMLCVINGISAKIIHNKSSILENSSSSLAKKFNSGYESLQIMKPNEGIQSGIHQMQLSSINYENVNSSSFDVRYNQESIHQISIPMSIVVTRRNGIPIVI